jgi:hypothetical protein
MLTLINKIDLGTFDWSIDSDEVLKQWLLFPGEFLEFMKKALIELSKKEDDVTKMLLIDFYKESYYWSKRCELVEEILRNTPCDPDLNTEQIEAWYNYKSFIKKKGKIDYKQL